MEDLQTSLNPPFLTTDMHNSLICIALCASTDGWPKVSLTEVMLTPIFPLVVRIVEFGN